MSRGGLHWILGGLVAVVAATAAAALIGLCPPQGPWPMPPWCGADDGVAAPGLPRPTPPGTGDDRADEPVRGDGPVRVYAEIVTPDADGEVFIEVDGSIFPLERLSPITAGGHVTLSYGQSYRVSMGSTSREGVFVGGYDAFLDDGRRTGIYPGVPHELPLPAHLLEADDLLFDHVPMTETGRPLDKGFYVGASGDAEAMRSGTFFDAARRELPIIQETGANWINLVPVWFFFPYDDGTYRTTSELRPMGAEEFYRQRNTGYIYPTFDDEELKAFIRDARAMGFKIYLAPHIVPAEYGPDTLPGKALLIPDDLDEFFANYRRMIAHYAELAEETGVELLAVGVENDSLTIPDQGVYPGVDLNAHWYEIIAEARSHFSGSLTYSAAAGDRDYSAPNQVTFWDALDYIGFEWYLPLTDEPDTSLPELVELAREAIEDLAKPLHEQYGKPLLFTEIGFEAKPYAWTRSYEGSDVGAEFDRLAAALSYEYVFQAIADVDFIEGMFVWSWAPAADSATFPVEMWWSIANPGNGVQHTIIQSQLSKWFHHHPSR